MTDKYLYVPDISNVAAVSQEINKDPRIRAAVLNKMRRGQYPTDLQGSFREMEAIAQRARELQLAQEEEKRKARREQRWDRSSERKFPKVIVGMGLITFGVISAGACMITSQVSAELAEPSIQMFQVAKDIISTYKNTPGICNALLSIGGIGTLVQILSWRRKRNNSN